MEKNEYLSELADAISESNPNKDYIDLCVNYASILFDNKLPVVFDTIHLSKLLGISSFELIRYLAKEELFYRKVKIPKKSGGTRNLNIPSVNLKQIQRWILDNILYNIPISDVSNGFCRHKSIVTNASKHLNKECVINVDIKDFFPSIDQKRAYRIFRYYGYSKEVSLVFAKICTYKNQLPQGSPASPYLSNIACVMLDKRLNRLAQKYDAQYTRYADDITFSGKYGMGRIISIIDQIIEDEGFHLNQKKTRITFRDQRQEVTGLLVNNSTLRVDKRYKRKVKQEIYYCLKYGVSDHLDYINCEKSFYKEHLYGKVFYIKMIEPVEGERLIKTLEKVEWEY